MSTYVLKPRPPRLLGLAALCLTVAAALFGIGWAWSQRWAWWIAAAVWAALGLIALLVAAAALRNRRVQIDLDAYGYAIHGPEGERTGAWKDVTRVALSRHRDKLALYHGERRRTIVTHPAGVCDDDFLRLRHEISLYLDPPSPGPRPSPPA
ncbi:MAG: hypothetical protein LBK42_00750 [Propionibacteriaceae bacterium]|jgi:uncharacterized protein (DUF58 family)|nr:hypothetical protein [Propionibacteriaceae bacterium]